MAVRQTFAFDTGPAGAAIATGGDIVDVSGATYSSNAMHGNFAAGFASGAQLVRINNSGTATHSGSLYLKLTTGPASSSARIVTFSSSANAFLLAIRAHSDGKFDISTAAARVASSTATWVANQWYRLDWQWNQVSTAAPQLTVRIFATPEGTTPTDTISYTAAGLSSPCQRWILGCLSSATCAGVLDTFRLADGLEWIGPFAAAQPTPGSVDHLWVGAPRQDGFRLVAKTTGATSTRMKVCTDAAMTQNAVFTQATAPDSAGYVSHIVSGLSANTQYYYQLEDTPTGGTATLIGDVGKARTLPAAGTAQNFTFAFGGCCTNNNPDGRAMTDLVGWNPNFMIHMGDFHYRNPTSTDPAVHAQLWANQIAGAGSGALKTMVRDMPMFYVRSDHDAGPSDNGDSNVPSNQASIDGYKQVVPAPTLADTRTPTVGLYFSWVVGRVRFIAVDIRNMDRSPGLDPQSPSKTMLGSVQKQWLKDQLLLGEFVKVIVSDVPWPGPASTSNGADKWWSYDDERTEIANFITSNHINCVMLTSDSHALLADTGANNSWGGFPIYGAAPLANIGGGLNLNYYSQVFNPGNTTDARQYGRVTVTDDGSVLTFHYQGYDVVSGSVKVDQTDTFGAATPPPTVRTFAFDDGPANATITTGGDVVQVTGATYNSDAMHGAFAAKLASGTQLVRVSNSGTATHSGSLYTKITSAPGSSAARIIAFSASDNTILLAIRANADGKFDIATTGGRVAASTATWTANHWYRLDWQWNQVSTAAPQLSVRIFATPEGSTPDDTMTYTASGLTSPCQRWTLGMLSGAAYAGLIDTFRVTDGQQWLGPFAGTMLAAGVGRVYDAQTGTWQQFTPTIQQNGQPTRAVAKVYKNGQWVASE